MHTLRITRDEWQEIYLAGFPNQRPAWAHALILTTLGAVEDDDSNIRLSDYEAEKFIESFDTVPAIPFPGLEHGSLSDKLYTLWDNVAWDIYLDRTHGCT